MSSSIFSSSWYRVAELVPSLRAHAQIRRMMFRGELWYLLQDHITGKFHRFTPAAHHLIGLMNGERTVAEIWSLASDRLGDDLPSQDETIRLLGQLYRANTLMTNAASDIDELVARDASVRRREFWANFRSPLAIKVPLWDPERFLTSAMPAVRFIFSVWGVVGWALVVGTALVLVGQHWSTLTEGIADRILAAENVLLLWLSFPIVKMLHEFGHAFAVRHWGGETHEIGVMFLVGVPVPYVDASSSSAFASRWQRALVGAAGVFVELFVAALAMFVWVSVEPGAVRAIAFNVMMIAGVSSLFFNGNPFLRFDAYYVLSDLIEMPNLGLRANRYWAYWIQTHVFGIQGIDNPATARHDSAWLSLYALGALINRMLITLSIATFVASKLFFVGVLIASWSITQFAILPLYRQARFVISSPQLRGIRGRALTWTLGALTTLGLLLFVVPAPSWTRAEGVVWAREDSIIRSRTDGEFKSFRVAPGTWVAAGVPLVELLNRDLVAEHEIAQAELKAYKAQYALDRTVDRVQAEITRQSLEHAKRRLDRARLELSSLVIWSTREGRFVVEGPENWPGRFLPRGQMIGYTISFDPMTIRVAVPESAVDLVRNSTERVDLRLAEDLGRIHSARIVAEVPAATNELPSFALTTEGGGKIALDPSERDKPHAFNRHFLFDLEVGGLEGDFGIGGRAYIRFAHTWEPMGFQFYRAARRLFLSQFNV